MAENKGLTECPECGNDPKIFITNKALPEKGKRIYEAVCLYDDCDQLFSYSLDTRTVTRRKA